MQLADELLIVDTAMGERATGRAGRVSYDFRDRVVVVTGGSRGIGTRIAEAFAESGANVVVNGRDRAALDHAVARLRSIGPGAVAAAGDLRDHDAALSVVDTAVDAFGTVDVLVNNAGGNFASPLDQVSANAWRAVLETNLSSAFHCAHACIPVFRRGGGGLIVNIGSVAGSAAHPGRAPYAAAKAGLAAVTKSMAWEWAPLGVRVNCVAPGAIRTPASRFADPDTADRVARHIPARRLGEPDDVAQACLFLCSDGADFITGQTLRVDGGPTAALVADELYPPVTTEYEKDEA